MPWDKDMLNRFIEITIAAGRSGCIESCQKEADTLLARILGAIEEVGPRNGAVLMALWVLIHFLVEDFDADDEMTH